MAKKKELVRFRRAISGRDFSYRRGTVRELNSTLARKFCKSGIAEPVQTQPKNLKTENASLKKRVKELEAEVKTLQESAVRTDEKPGASEDAGAGGSAKEASDEKPVS